MKKEIVHQIKRIAAVLPEKWETVIVDTLLPGTEAALTVVGKSPYDPNKNYIVKTPIFTRINHESRIKDGYKLYGEKFIAEYIKHITNA